jgi:hypothetical protein
MTATCCNAAMSRLGDKRSLVGQTDRNMAVSRSQDPAAGARDFSVAHPPVRAPHAPIALYLFRQQRPFAFARRTARRPLGRLASQLGGFGPSWPPPASIARQDTADPIGSPTRPQSNKGARSYLWCASAWFWQSSRNTTIPCINFNAVASYRIGDAMGQHGLE